MSSLTIHLAAWMLAHAPVDSTKPRPISQMVHTTWTAKDGAPSEVLAFAQTREGYLWIGTRSGLIRFDGVRFVQFTAPTGDTLPTGGVLSLRATHDGSLWVVSTSGWVSRIRDGRVTSFGEKDGVPATVQLAESRAGMLLAATTKGIRQFAGGAWNDAGAEWRYTGGETKAIWFDREDELWVEAHDRFLYLPAGANRFVDPGMKLLYGSDRGMFAETNDGAIWFTEVRRSAHTVSRSGDSRPVTEVLGGTFNLLVDRKGSLWLGSVGDGLRRLLDPTTVHGGKIGPSDPIGEKYAEKEGLLSGIVNAIFEDREGNIWVATDRGIERFRESAFTPFPAPGPARPRFVFASRDTSIWSAAFNYPWMIRMRPTSRDSIPTLILGNVAEDRSGTLWFAQNNRIGWIKDLRMSTASVGRPSAFYRGITTDSTGNVWVFETGYGLARATATGVVRVDSLPTADRSLYALTMFADRAGRIWIGHVGHVTMADHGQMRVFGPNQGVMPGHVNGFLEDSGGAIWFVGDAGISKFDRDHFRSIPRRQSLPGRSVYGAAEDALGAWWVVTPGAVLRLPPGEVDRALADSNHVISYRTFGVLDGIPGMLSGSAWGPQIARAPDGRIWIAADSGVASIDPRNLPNDAVPEVLIEAARVGGFELTWPASGIGPRMSDLEIDYTATALANPERIQFRYRLEGADSAWHDVGARRRAYFTGLAPGSYVFRVSARNGEGSWSEAGAVWPFRVLPAWYQTLWLRAAVLLMFAGLIALGSRMVQRRRDLQTRERVKNEYEATLAERSRIAQDLHDTLLQGFVGVTVQIQAAEFALSKQPDVAAQTLVTVERLERASRLARASLKEARERVWDMREELGADDLPAALEAFARERTAGSGVEISVINKGHRRRLSARVEDAVFRIGREALVNAVRHAQARRIEIHVEFEPNTVRLDVLDDGRGFSAEQAEDAQREGHFGLSGARERAEFFGGHFDVRPRPGGGTVVSLELPLQNTPKDVLSLSASRA
jgi:signal transduction histidine kinase/ligand-binding sensor domain-containing protein